MKVVNPLHVPLAMEEEGAGPKSPFWPSSANTNVNGIIPSNFFMDSEKCGECHKDAYEQWKGSMHHFASFNNQFYRKSIEHMQDSVGTKPRVEVVRRLPRSRGLFQRPFRQAHQGPDRHSRGAERPGLRVVPLHRARRFDHGQRRLHDRIPAAARTGSSKNPYIQAMDHFLTYLDPEPHRRTFLKPFMKEDSSEFCSTCHKVHLDVPVNNYRWLRGFNDYDNWQASGFGEGARSFYYPPKAADLRDCHMPLVPSNDPGNRNGMVHNHRFAAANTAVPHVNDDKTQLAATESIPQVGFHHRGYLRRRADRREGARDVQMRRAGDAAPQALTSFAVGEEAESPGPAFSAKVGKLAAPLDKSGTRFQPGSTIRVDVVVRTRKIGHFFPGGTVDAFDVWLELEGKDATGKHWSSGAGAGRRWRQGPGGEGRPFLPR